MHVALLCDAKIANRLRQKNYRSSRYPRNTGASHETLGREGIFQREDKRDSCSITIVVNLIVFLEAPGRPGSPNRVGTPIMTSRRGTNFSTDNHFLNEDLLYP